MPTPVPVVTIRSATGDDVEAWLALRRALWSDVDDATHHAEIADQLAAHAAGRGTTLLAIAGDGTKLGFAELSLRPFAEGCGDGPIAYLEGWFVTAAHRRSGLGRRLVQAGEAWGRAQGCREFASDAEIDNEISRRAHLASGFDEVAVVRCFRKPL